MGLEKVDLVQSKGQGLRKQGFLFFQERFHFVAFRKLKMKVSFPFGPLEWSVFMLLASQALWRARAVLISLVKTLWLKATQKSVRYSPGVKSIFRHTRLLPSPYTLSSIEVSRTFSVSEA